MAHPSEADWIEFDDGNESHCAGHGVTPSELTQVFENDPLWARNKKGRTAAWLMVGRTLGGRAIVAAVEYDEIRSAVRPITARECESHEISLWRL